MTTSGDFDTMVAIADAEIDKWLGGHADDNLTQLYIKHKNLANGSELSLIRLLFAMVCKQADQIYDLENAI